MAHSRQKAKGRSDSGPLAAIPKAVLETDKYAQLSGWEAKLLLDLASQYNLSNNGDLAAAWTLMRRRGWRSKGTLNRAISKLLGVGFIEKTRQGGRNRCSLYAFTWKPIDHCKGKLEVKPTTVAKGIWKDEKN